MRTRSSASAAPPPSGSGGAPPPSGSGGGAPEARSGPPSRAHPDMDEDGGQIAGPGFYYQQPRRFRHHVPLDRADRSRHEPPRFGNAAGLQPRRSGGGPGGGDEAAKKTLRNARGQHFRLFADHVRIAQRITPGGPIPGAPSYSALCQQLGVLAVQYDAWGPSPPLGLQGTPPSVAGLLIDIAEWQVTPATQVFPLFLILLDRATVPSSAPGKPPPLVAAAPRRLS